MFRCFDESDALGYDLAGRRTQLTYPGTGLYVNTDYLVTGEATAIRENGAVSGVGVLATYAYDDLGNRTSVTFGNGVVQAYTFDPVSRLASLTNNLSGTTNDLTISPIAYSPASQIASNVRTGDAYAWTDHYNVNRAYASNGLNQHATAGPAAFTYDAKGNLTSDGTNSFAYSSENLLTSATVGTAATLAYDPALRLYQVAGAATTRFAYDGAGMIAEYNGSNALQRRFVFGPGTDAPIVQYEGAGTTDRRFMSADERGSIIALTDSSGALLNINRYDEYGTPQTTNAGRFGYTGQAWIAELGMNYYKARIYSPTLGRFLQTDPIGYVDSPNLYAYVLNDPVNYVDPFGLTKTIPCNPAQSGSCKEVIITGQQLGGWPTDLDSASIAPRSDDLAATLSADFALGNEALDTIYVTGKKKAQPKPKNQCAASGTAPSPQEYRSMGDAANQVDPIVLGAPSTSLLASMRNFKRGGSLDAQVRYGGSPAYANYVFGVYAAAGGLSLQQTLGFANSYGQYRSSYPAQTDMDRVYTHIPRANVVNITRGFNDTNSNRLCTR